ncbi:MAG TPA: tyrosine-protein phosphatase [Gemmataceae bacterium]|jgi:hypothetical protein|nr:tyrosine-protein phosphatase [Gemmataceae bacterium]
MPGAGVPSDYAEPSVPAVPGKRVVVWNKILLRAAILAACLIPGIETYRIFLGRNLHEVIPGQVYRSAQLTGSELERVVRKYGILTVINLRGSCDPLPWYLDECRATHRLQISQEDICFSSGRLPSSTEVRRLTEVLERTQYPILLHCKRGADRTGLAAAVVLLLCTDTDYPAARRQLSLRYGHLAVGRPAYLDVFFEHYTNWLRAQGLQHSKEVFRRWLVHDYCPGPCRATLALLDRPGLLKTGEPAVLRVHARNDGIEPWHLQASTNAGIHVCFNLKDTSGKLVGQWRAGLFDREVPVGQGIDLDLALPGVDTPGHYYLSVDMIDEQQSFFFQTGSEPLELELDVK